jgi:hypothetical protein
LLEALLFYVRLTSRLPLIGGFLAALLGRVLNL